MQFELSLVEEQSSLLTHGEVRKSWAIRTYVPVSLAFSFHESHFFGYRQLLIFVRSAVFRHRPSYCSSQNRISFTRNSAALFCLRTRSCWYFVFVTLEVTVYIDLCLSVPFYAQILFSISSFRTFGR